MTAAERFETSVSTAPDCAYPGAHGAKCVCGKKSTQRTIAGAFLKAAADQLPAASDAEVDELIARIESLKLAKLLRQRAALVDSITEHVDVTKALHAAMSDLQLGIDELIRRGVQP